MYCSLKWQSFVEVPNSKNDFGQKVMKRVFPTCMQYSTLGICERKTAQMWYFNLF